MMHKIKNTSGCLVGLSLYLSYNHRYESMEDWTQETKWHVCPINVFLNFNCCISILPEFCNSFPELVPQTGTDQIVWSLAQKSSWRLFLATSAWCCKNELKMHDYFIIPSHSQCALFIRVSYDKDLLLKALFEVFNLIQGTFYYYLNPDKKRTVGE